MIKPTPREIQKQALENLGRRSPSPREILKEVQDDFIAKLNEQARAEKEALEATLKAGIPAVKGAIPLEWFSVPAIAAEGLRRELAETLAAINRS